MADAPAVRQWLQTILEADERFRQGDPDKKYIGMTEARMARVLLAHGKVYGPRIALPDGVEYGRAKDCFGNALHVASDPFSRDPVPYKYVEGYAYTPGVIACHHAWVINERGEVVDPTWRDGGNECGFCDDGLVAVQVCAEHDIDIESCGCDEDDVGYYEDEIKCRMCGGTGETEFEHPLREGTEYLGIEFDAKDASRVVVESGTYGVLDKVLDRYLGTA